MRKTSFQEAVHVLPADPHTGIFCKAAGIPCEELNPETYFKKGMCDGVFRTREYTYSAMSLKQYLLEKLAEQDERVSILCRAKITGINQDNDTFTIKTEGGKSYQSGYVLNASYAGTNQILEMAGFEKFGINAAVFKHFQPLPNRLHAHSGNTLAKRHRNTAVRIKRTEFFQIVRSVARNIRKNGVGVLF